MNKGTMLSMLHHRSIVVLFLLAAAHGRGQSRTVAYQWLNQPCAEMINCEGGCSACDLPTADQVVFGTNAALIGLDACPHPVTVGDNALLLSGWTDAPSDDHRVLVTIIAQTSIRIDSVVVVHRMADDGPSRLHVSLTKPSGEGQVIHDGQVPEEFAATTMVNCGEALMEEGMAYTSFQVQLQAYSGSGDWYLDELRIVVSELHEGPTTGVMEFQAEDRSTGSALYDPLGRAMGPGWRGLGIRNGYMVIRP